MTDETVRVDPLPEPEDELGLIRAALDGEYEILEELGRGGMAVVYRAREIALDREVALKVLPIARTFDAELVARFQREAKLAAALEHPHIVPIHRVGQTGRISYFAMKYLRGASLAETLEAQGALEPAEVERLLLEVGAALHHAHAHGVVHRDLKPDNIMADAHGAWVVMDFGIARSAEGDRLTQTGGSIGTPKYMSPEQGKGLDVDGRSDFYSLGVVAYHALTGRPPFERADTLTTLLAHVNEPVPEPELSSEEARRVWGAVRRLLEKDPAQRPRSLAGLRDVLAGDAAAGSSPAGTPVAGAAGAAGGATAGAPTAAAGASGPAGAGTPRAPGAGASSPTPRAPDDPVAWLRSRDRRFWAVAGGVALVLFFLFGPDGAGRACRDALQGTGDDGRALLIEPVGTVANGDDIDLAFTVCGVPRSRSFRTEVVVRSADDGGVIGGLGRFFSGERTEARQSWDDESDGLATERVRTIDPGDLPPGAWRITVTVEDGGGRQAEASHDFTVAGG